MGAFGGAKAQNFLKVLAPVGARKEAFADGGRAKKSDIFSRLLAGWGRRRREKKSGRAEIHLGFLPFTGQSAACLTPMWTH